CGFACIFEGFIRQKELDMEKAYDAIPVSVVVSNITGTQTDQLEIADYVVNYFLSDRYVYGGQEQPRAFSTYIKDVSAQATVYYSAGHLPERSPGQKLSGITDMAAATGLSEAEGIYITFFPGWDAGLFSTDQQVCAVPAAFLEGREPDADGRYRFTLSVRISPDSGREERVTLEVAGTYPGDSKTIYCPWECAAELQRTLDGKITADNLRAVVRDNRELDEFREILMRHFAEVSPAGQQEEIFNSPILHYQPYAITVHDEILRSTLNSLHRNLQTLYHLRPLFAGIELLVCLAAYFSYFHIRRRELAVMRSLGVRRAQTVLAVLTEAVILFLAGMGMGVLLSLLWPLVLIPAWIVCGIALAAVAGALGACLMATGQKGVSILREAE
ncbi:MAG: ABC transporter permease, partial [Acetatifactor sp.]|nr:ABC transporter permease [Acetatifactor sp.]